MKNKDEIEKERERKRDEIKIGKISSEVENGGEKNKDEKEKRSEI